MRSSEGSMRLSGHRVERGLDVVSHDSRVREARRPGRESRAEPIRAAL